MIGLENWRHGAEKCCLYTKILGNHGSYQFTHHRHNNEYRRKGDGEGFPEGPEPSGDEAVDESEIDKGDDEWHEKRHEQGHKEGEKQGLEVFRDHSLPLM